MKGAIFAENGRGPATSYIHYSSVDEHMRFFFFFFLVVKVKHQRPPLWRHVSTMASLLLNANKAVLSAQWGRCIPHPYSITILRTTWATYEVISDYRSTSKLSAHLISSDDQSCKKYIDKKSERQVATATRPTAWYNVVPTANTGDLLSAANALDVYLLSWNKSAPSLCPLVKLIVSGLLPNQRRIAENVRVVAALLAPLKVLAG